VKARAVRVVVAPSALVAVFWVRGGMRVFTRKVVVGGMGLRVAGAWWLQGWQRGLSSVPCR